jgi:ATP-dependent protease ClpP protease subunit
MEKFIARYADKNGIKKSLCFDKSKFNEQQAKEYLAEKGIKNFLFFFEPNPPTPFGENGIHFEGEIGFDITMNNLLPYIEAGNEIIIDSFGGDLFEGWKIHDAIKLTGKNPSITVLGTCASSAVQILLSTENRKMTGQSRLLIHNPWMWEVGDDEVMQRAAIELKNEKTRLAKFYAEISGKPIEEILDTMKQERFMHIDECIAMNFVKGESNINENQTEMNAEQEAKLNSIGSGIENLANTIKNLFIKPKNVVVQDVDGNEIDFGEDAETVEQIAIGDTATVNGEPANGEYVLQDDTVYVFENGTLTEIRMPEETDENAEMEQLRQENEALKQENEQLKNSLTEKESLYNDLKSNSEKVQDEFTKLSNDFTEFKGRFSNEKEEIKSPEDEKPEKKGFKFNKSKIRKN